MAVITDDGLLERGRELAELCGLLDVVAGGAGGLVVVRGPAGIGKSTLLASVRQEARARGMAVFAARGEEFEREFAFGVARQLFERVAEERHASGRLTGAAALAATPLGLVGLARPRRPDERFASRHGLYWLAADLAAEAPLVLTVDEAQWADSPSLQWLAFLAGRLEDVAIALVLAVRDESEIDPSLAKMEVEPLARTITPGHLSKRAVAQMAAQILGNDPSPELLEAVYAAAGGNPLWTRELLRALPMNGALPVVSGGALTEATPASVTRTVLVRLRQLGPVAVELARAVAVLGSRAAAADAAIVAGLDPLAVGQSAAVLERAGIFGSNAEDLSFSHPILRQAVYADVGAAQRAVAHAEAARALAARDAESEQVVSHLLLTPPGGSQWVVDQLRLAAEVALARGAPETAISYLRRAEREQGGADAELLHALGVAEAMIADMAAPAHLLAAYRAAADGSKPGIAVEAAQAMLTNVDVDGAVDLLERALAECALSDREGRLRLTAALTLARLFRRDVADPPHPLPAGCTPGERALLASAAAAQLARDAPARATLEMARAAWSEGRLLADEGPDSPHVLAVVMATVMCDAYEEATALLGGVLAEAQRRGSVSGFITAMTARAYVAYRRGDLHQASADARAALEIERAHPVTIVTPGALGFLIETLIETGELEEAEAALRAHGWDGAIPDLYPLDVLLERRGRLRIAQGDLETGLADLHEAQRRLAWFRNPIGNLESHAALALALLGRHEEARPLVAHELELARRIGLPRQIAIALRAAALVEVPADLELLRESAELAASAGARLEEARALADIGAALRRRGQRSAARDPLRHALDLATRAGATVLAKRIREELLAAGARPRRVMLTGRDALTPSELRIADLAAGGCSNREIAQDLFVTVRTVEMHLSAAYRKLGVGTRAELPAVLAPPSAAAETASVFAPKSFGRST